jgi:hypothetical protein
VFDVVAAGSLATIDADGSEGSDAGEVGNWAAEAEEPAGTTTAVEDAASEVFFEQAASASSEAAATKIQLRFIFISPCERATALFASTLSERAIPHPQAHDPCATSARLEPFA